MNILEKLIGLDSIEDVTETSWWTDGVFRRLENDASEIQGIDYEVAAAPLQMTNGLE